MEDNDDLERVQLCLELAREAERYAVQARLVVQRENYLFIAQHWRALAEKKRERFDPFAANAEPRIAPPLQATFTQLMQHVSRRAGVLVVIGGPGTGKTLLLQLLEETCARNGFSVRLISRGDLAHLAVGAQCDLLLVDEADCVPDELLRALMSPQTRAAVSTIFACAHAPAALYAAETSATFVRLEHLTEKEAEDYLQLVAPKPGLFSPEAVKLLTIAAGGSIRMLRSIASFAIFCAGLNGRTQVAFDDVEEAVASRAIETRDTPGPIVSPRPLAEAGVSLAAETKPNDPTPLAAPQYKWPPAPLAALHNASAWGMRLREEFSWKIAGVCLATAGCLAIVALAFQNPQDHTQQRRTLALSRPESLIAQNKPSTGKGENILEKAQADGRLPASQLWQQRAGQPTVAPLTRDRLAMRSVDRLFDPPQLRNLQRQARVRFVPESVEMRLSFATTRLSGFVAMAENEAVVHALGHETILDLTTTLSDAKETQPHGRPKRKSEVQVASNPSGRVIQTSFSIDASEGASAPGSDGGPLASSEPSQPEAAFVVAAKDQTTSGSQPGFDASDTPFPDDSGNARGVLSPLKMLRSKATAPLPSTNVMFEIGQTAQAAKLISIPAQAVKEAAGQAMLAQDTNEQAKSARDSVDQSKAAKEAADQSQAARQLAGEAKVVKETAEQAKAAKEAADQAKAAKEAADQAKAAKEAADQAKAAKEAADQAKAAKEAADQAKAAKEAADQAKAAKEAADQAKAAKDAADQAKAAKEAADQAKAAKEAADQAKAAKDAADQAKAAKEAADQAKAAKDAAGQAKAAKEAADQAKAAKDAADQAKAAKEAADQAKAAKDAADQAKAAKEAADQAKAAKDATDQAKAVKDAVEAAKFARAR